MDKQAKLKLLGLIGLFILSISFLVYSTSLDSPIESFIDDDGYLDLRGSCTPTTATSNTHYNITNATLYSNVGGSWVKNKTLSVPTASIKANQTYYFNFTNDINRTSEGTYLWNIECNEQNSTGSLINKAFAVNRTIIVNYADASISDITPADGIYDLDGHAITGSCTASPSSGWNLTTMTLMTTISGSWINNQTYSMSAPEEGSAIFNYTINGFGNASIGDGTNLLFSCLARQTLNASSSGTESLVVSDFSSANRTINIEYPPNISLTSPANNIWTGALTDLFNFTAVSYWGISGTNLFQCSFWSNETGTWGQSLGVMTAINNTPKTFNYQFEEGVVNWGVRCQEGGDANVFNFSINRTLNIDRTFPIISIANISTGSLFKHREVTFNYSLTERNPSSCRLYLNDTLNSTDTNVPMDGNLTFSASVDGFWTSLVSCNDTSNNWKNSTNITFTTDATFPTYTAISNFSQPDYADRRVINFTASEPVNATLFYGITVNTGSVSNNKSFLSSQNVTLSALTGLNTLYYFNITICDNVGNCNRSGESLTQFHFRSPFTLLQGWSYYGVNDAVINFSTILTQTNAEYVYFWNSTNQAWISATKGGTTEMGFEVGAALNRNIVAIYDSVNSTWARNTSTSVAYTVNLTRGDNFLKIYDNRSMGQLVRSFLNASVISATPGAYLYGYGPLVSTSGETPLIYNMSKFYFSAYNNSGVDWEIDYVYNTTTNNNTFIYNASDFEVVWVYSAANLTWNGSNILRNWTI